MNLHEKAAVDKYEALGYDVITKGVPDLILLKDGKISFLEVKSMYESPIQESQRRAIDILRKHGYSVELRVFGYAVNDIIMDQGEYDPDNRRYRQYKPPETKCRGLKMNKGEYEFAFRMAKVRVPPWFMCCGEYDCPFWRGTYKCLASKCPKVKNDE